MSFPFDAVLVLGKALRGDPERAMRELRARAAAASAALRAGAARALSLEARMRGQERAGCEIVADILSDLGVSADRLVLAARSRSTREEAEVAAEMCDALGVCRLVAVTSSYHVLRARRVLEERLGVARVSVHGTAAFLGLADARERALILAGEPCAATLAHEGRTERCLGLAEAAVFPLPRRLRWRLEVSAGRLWRRAGSPVRDFPRGFREQ